MWPMAAEGKGLDLRDPAEHTSDSQCSQWLQTPAAVRRVHVTGRGRKVTETQKGEILTTAPGGPGTPRSPAFPGSPCVEREARLRVTGHDLPE